MAVHPQGPSPSPNQQVPRPFTQTTSHLPRETDRPNLQQPTPTASPAFMITARPANQPSGLRGKHRKQKIDKDKPRWDPIPITYTELFLKLVEIGHIEPVQLAPLRPSFPRWYNAHSMRLSWRESRSSHEKLHRTQIQGPRSGQQWKTEV